MSPDPASIDRGSIEALMAATVAEALRGEAEGGQPVGSLVIDTAGQVVGRGHNRVVQDRDILAHAELDAVRSVAEPVDLRCTTLTTTAEPCWLCAGMVVQVGIPRIVVGRTTDGGRIDWLRLRGVAVVEAEDRTSAGITDGYFRPRSRPLIPGKRLGAFPADALVSYLPGGTMTLGGWASVYRFRRVPVPRTEIAVLMVERAEGPRMCRPDGDVAGAQRRAAVRGSREVADLARRNDIPVVFTGPGGPPLADQLGAAGARSVVICGAPTSTAVLAAAVGAGVGGLEVFVVADATADDEEAIHIGALYAVDRGFGRVCHVDDLMRSWGGGDA